MKLFKSFFCTALIALFVLTSFVSSETKQSKWLVDFEEAKIEASNSEHIILLSFQGSDWCNNCRRLEKVLFENEDFITFSNDNLTLLKADFPMKKENALSKEQSKKNDALAEKFNPDGKFPLVVLLNSKGEKIGELTYPSKNVESYINSIRSVIK